MTKQQTILGLTVLFLVCLGIGVIWTARTQPPPGNPWWAGKEAKVRMEVWEPGKDMATFAMTLPKKTVDGMVALGLKAVVQVGHYDVDFRKHWRAVQALPPGEKYKLSEDDADIYIWIETPDVKPAPVVPAAAAAESSGA